LEDSPLSFCNLQSAEKQLLIAFSGFPIVTYSCVHGTVNTANVVNMLKSLFLRFRTLKIAR